MPRRDELEHNRTLRKRFQLIKNERSTNWRQIFEIFYRLRPLDEPSYSETEDSPQTFTNYVRNPATADAATGTDNYYSWPVNTSDNVGQKVRAAVALARFRLVRETLPSHLKSPEHHKAKKQDEPARSTTSARSLSTLSAAVGPCRRITDYKEFARIVAALPPVPRPARIPHRIAGLWGTVMCNCTRSATNFARSTTGFSCDWSTAV